MLAQINDITTVTIILGFDPTFVFLLFLGPIVSLWLIPIKDYIFPMKSIWKNIYCNRLTQKKKQRFLSEIKIH